MSAVDTIAAPEDAAWRDAVAAIRSGLRGASRGASRGAPPRWESIFGPLRAGLVDDLMVVGQIGQSLDGRAATTTGHSHYINGADGLDHLHRLRALVDAVVVGVGTAIADDPLLTVRRVAGPHPARVVIDPTGRLPAAARLLRDDGVRRIVISANTAGAPVGVEHIVLATHQGHFDPAAILAGLAQRGLRRILIEGGPATVARFIDARCLDRLHVVISPIILGGGRASLDLTPITRCEDALRPVTRTHVLGDAGTDGIGREVLFDCDLTARRRPVDAGG
jgi:diaminohydroxyphosphoribosylaminopyrimidine deaminase/5-amino-6-(5-phosphoribosylamino)uracil reductase